MKKQAVCGIVFGIFASIFSLGFVSAALVSPALLQTSDSSGLMDVSVWVSDAAAFDSIIAQVGADNVVERFYPDAFVAKLNAKQVSYLAKRGDVSILEPTLKFEIVMYDAVGITGANKVWPLKLNSVNLKGNGETIAIVDTGIDFNHVDLAGKNIAGVEFDCYNNIDCAGSSNVSDLNGHGTHVAGIAGASGGINGIAPDVNLVALKVFNSSSGSFTSSVPIVRAINFVVQYADQYNISVISMSIASSGTWTGYCDSTLPSLKNAINSAVAKNISVVASAGNNYKSDAIALPSCISSVIPVAASNKDDTLASYSNINSLVKLVAPGTAIISTKMGGGYTAMGGTSMATPMISASIALINQYLALKGKPKMTPQQIEDILASNGDALIGTAGIGQKRVNLERVFTFFKVPKANENAVEISAVNVSGIDR